MSFKDCIDAAIKSERISRDKGDEAHKAYDRHFNEAKAAGMDDRAAANAASLAAVESIVKQKGDLRWRRKNEMIVAARIAKHLDAAKDPWEVPMTMLDGSDRSYTGPAEVVVHRRVLGQAEARFVKNLEAYRPRAAGTVNPVRHLDNIVDEMFDVKTGDTSAKELAAEFPDVTDFLVKQANARGASIPPHPRGSKRYLPQQHDRMKMRRAGTTIEESRKIWVADHLPRLDWDAMLSFFDGQKIPIDKREEVLGNVFDTIITDGGNKIKPGQQRTENLASQMSHKRFMVYKDADAWKEMNAKYGSGNVFQSMVAYMDAMSRDIAKLEVWGPNPSAMKAYVENEVRARAAQRDLVDTRKTRNPLTKPYGDIAKDKLGTFNAMWDVNNFANSASENSLSANTLSGTRNYLTGSLMGSAVISAVPGDLFTMKFAQAANKMPQTAVISSYLRLMAEASPVLDKILGTKRAKTQAAIRAGLIAESASQMAAGYHRYFGVMSGPEMSRRFTDVVLRATLLTPHTQAVKWTWGMEMMGLFSDVASKKFDDLPFKSMLEAYDISAADWDLFRATAPMEKGLLRPDDLWRSTAGDEARNKKVADRFMDMILTEQRYGVVESNLRSQVILKGNQRAGTFAGELLRSGAMFKSFATTIMMQSWGEMLRRSTVQGRAAYAATFFAGLTIMGAFSEQANNLASGRDPLDMTTSAFWAKAAMRGGGLGYLGDFAFSGLNRYGASTGQMLAGPIPELFNQVRNLTVGNIVEMAQGKKTNASRELVQLVGRYNALNTGFYTKLLFRRLAIDQMMQEADPAAYRRMKQAEQRDLKTYNQGSWWGPGDTEPDRAPDWGAVIGGSRR